MNFKVIFTLALMAIMPLGTIQAYEGKAITPQEALQRLTIGNERYTHDRLLHPDRSSERREAVSSKQTPFAVIVGCSDSRVPPEIIFDQGVGDLFIVRVAGNVVGRLELDSIDYGALHLGASVVLVLGHQNCGAVKAVLSQETQGIEAIAALIEPAVAKFRNVKEDGLTDAIKANVKFVVRQLKNSPLLSRLIKEKKIEVNGGFYHLDTGKVELLETD